MNRERTWHSRGLSAALCGVAGAALCSLAGCNDVEKAPPRPRAANISDSIPMDVPEMMRGTVGSLALLDGYNEQVVVKGWGFVVGLKGTGGTILAEPVRAHMLAEMARRGVGQRSMGSEMSPEALLSSPDTAVVVVEAVLPPGAPLGTEFDVRVSRLPDSDTTSLEGGILWTTDLRPCGPGLPPVGSRQARALAVAKGPIFTNPFVAMPSTVAQGADGGLAEDDPLTAIDLSSGTSINPFVGRILGGGRVTRDMPLKLRLASPSHRMASLLQQVINSRFPQEPGQRDKTARGESEASIELTVPPSYHGRTEEFAYLVQHTSVLPAPPEALAHHVGRILEQSPGDADHASWRWQALGAPALPAVRQFYDYPEEKPRYASLRAGAALNDPLAIPHLLDLTEDGPPPLRKDAIALLGKMKPEPRIYNGLRELLDDEDVDVRIAAYEALAEGGTLFVRSMVVDEKFIVDFIESQEPLIYVSLLDTPRIAVFGRGVEIERPMTLSTWSNRLLMRGDSGEERMEVYYRDESGQAAPYRVSSRLSEFIPFLGHTSTIEEPAPGLGLTYSQTVGVLYALYQAQYLPAEFRTQADRIMLAIRERDQNWSEYQQRPEFDEVIDEDSGFDDMPEQWPSDEIFAPVGSGVDVPRPVGAGESGR